MVADPTPPEGLPVWLQTIIYIGGLLGAFAAAWKGWISKAKPTEAPNAIIAGDIMSTKPMRDLADGVAILNSNSVKVQDGQDRIIDALNRLTDAERSTEQAIRDMCRDQQRGVERIVQAIELSSEIATRPR